jgi:phage-related protein
VIAPARERGIVGAMPKTRIAVGAAAAVAAVLVAASCGSGGSEQSATVKWADGICSAVVDYENALKDAAAPLRSTLSRESLDQAAKNVKEASQDFADSIQSVGKPDTQSGKQAQQILHDLSSSLKEDANAIQDAGGGSARSAIAVVGTTLVTAQSQISAAIDKLQQLDVESELKDAFSQASACDDLSGK